MPVYWLFVFSRWSLAILICSLFLLRIPGAYAQTATPVRGQPTCDLCGWCNQTVNPKPDNHDQCKACLYEADGITEKQSSFYTVFGCIQSSTPADKPSDLPGQLVKSALSIVFSISGGIAFLSFLYGTSVVLTSAGDPQRLQAGKDTITSSLIGLLLVIFSVFLLRTIGLDILQIPGFG